MVFHLRFSKAAGLFSKISATMGQLSKSEQSPQVATPFSNAQRRIPHILSQNTVFIPSARHPWQLICSGRMGALFNSAHSFAVCFRNSSLSLIVARYASHFSQSNPQYAIFFFIVMYLFNFRLYNLPHEIAICRFSKRNSEANSAT